MEGVDTGLSTRSATASGLVTQAAMISSRFMLKHPLEVFRQRVQVDIFNRNIEGEVPVVTAPACGLTYTAPVGGSVTNTPETFPFDKGFQ